MKQRIIIGLILLFSANYILGQQEKEKDPEKLVYLQVGDEAVKAAVQAGFEAFHGPLYSDPGLPAFTLISRNKRIAAGVGGYVRFTTSFDFGGIMPSNDFIPFLIPVGQVQQRSQFKMEAATSRLYLRFIADTKYGVFHFYVETDFRASGNRNRFNAIYATWRGFRIGRYWTVMADLESYPPSIDFQGPNAFSGTSTYQISYQGDFNPHFSYGIGLELPDYSIADSLVAYKMPQRIPTLPGYLQYGNSYGHLRVASMARPLVYKNTLTGGTEYAMTWGVVGSAIVKPSRKSTFYLQSVYGKGIGTYNFELNGNGLDLIPDPDKAGKLRPAGFWGGFVGTQYKFTPFFQASAIYSYLRLLKNGLNDPYLYKEGQYVVATGYFNLTPRMQLAIEYDYGYLNLRNNRNGHANRIMGMIRYDF